MLGSGGFRVAGFLLVADFGGKVSPAGLVLGVVLCRCFGGFVFYVLGKHVYW